MMIYKASVESICGYGLSAYSTDKNMATRILSSAVKKWARENEISLREDWQEWHGVTVEPIILEYAYLEGNPEKPYL